MRYFYLLLLYTYGKNCAEMQRYSFFPLNTIFVSKESKLCTGGMSYSGASWRGVSGVPTEDPVKNGASSNDC